LLSWWCLITPLFMAFDYPFIYGLWLSLYSWRLIAPLFMASDYPFIYGVWLPPYSWRLITLLLMASDYPFIYGVWLPLYWWRLITPLLMASDYPFAIFKFPHTFSRVVCLLCQVKEKRVVISFIRWHSVFYFSNQFSIELSRVLEFEAFLEMWYIIVIKRVFVTTKVVSSNPVHGEVYWIQHYAIKFVSDLWQVVVLI
jgi:hypothetical protein